MKTVTASSTVATMWCSMLLASTITTTKAFIPNPNFTPSPATRGTQSLPTRATVSLSTSLRAAPKRLPSNVDGPLYVNDRCINCSACSMFAPTVFERNSQQQGRAAHHVVYHQPTTEEEIETARAALSACPVAAIRVETSAQRNHRNQHPPLTQHEQDLVKALAISPKLNGRDLPFPRLVSSHQQQQQQQAPNYFPNVFFMGHHNEKTFGATPYLFYTAHNDKWIMVDTPRFGKPAVEALERVTDGRPPDYLILTHVDDTAGHYYWKDHYPNLQRVFHAGDLGTNNWIGDKTLENVEILLSQQTSSTNIRTHDVSTSPSLSLQAFDLNGHPINNDKNTLQDEEVVILHTPGHSPGSISVLYRPISVVPGDYPNSSSDPPKGVLFTGDTYAYRLSSNAMTGFPRYGNNLPLQATILQSLVNDWGTEWDLLAPGHGHVRDYSGLADTKAERLEIQKTELQPAIEELKEYATAVRRW